MSGRRNPYVGARPFERKKGEVLYGRDREVRELAALLIAERIALLYSPSGAGKTSLIQALLLDEMEKEGFEALPVIRVSTELCPGEREALAGTAVNRYVLSALLALEETVPAERQIPVSELAGMSFDAYMTRRTETLAADRSPFLIFDQFEEVLTLDATDLAAKEAFFDQVGTALRNRERWALFAMREDYVGPLEPYLRRLPTRLRTTFRLDLLDVAAAQQAIRKPAAGEGVEFDEAAAAALTDNLRAVWVRRADRSRERQPGPYIEPVQLQVVCHRLWDRLPDGAARIRVADVDALGDVDAALAGYYADRVAAIAGATGVSERILREWVDSQLITEQQLRGQVPLALEEKSQGLDNRAIQGLIDAHLVRAERRRETTWLELAHDRLIEPVKADNAEWLRTHLNDFQRHAALWARQGRPESLLLQGRAAQEAETWAGEHEPELTAVERDFLAASRKAREEALKEEERQRTAVRITEVEGEKSRFRRLAYFAATLALVAVAMAGFAFWQMAKAEQATAVATAARLDAEKSVQAKEAALIDLKQANDDLQRRTEQLINVVPAVPREQVVVARRVAREIATLEAPGGVGSPIRVQYFARNPDEELISRLAERGFKVKPFPNRPYNAVNTIWYGTGISADELRLLALTLFESGVKVQRITPFQGKKRPRIVSVGTDPNWLTAPLYTVEQLRELSPGTTASPQAPASSLFAPSVAHEPPR